MVIINVGGGGADPHCHKLALDDVFFLFTLVLCSFWTSRGHRCRPFFPPVLVLNFYRA